VSLRAVLFDAGNTLLFLDHERLASTVGAALGLSLEAAALDRSAGAATRAVEGARGADRDRARLYLEVLFTGAGVPATRDALDRLRAAGLRLGVVSNSDGRVEEALEAAGLRDRFDVVLDSALVGVEKPDPAIFRAALAALGVAPAEALYVGDLYEVDVVGARAAGMQAALLATGEAPGADCRRFESLVALADDLLTGGRP
jgi:putative hydrolase of the HAD superfamily